MGLKNKLSILTLATLIGTNFLAINVNATGNDIFDTFKQFERLDSKEYSFKATEDFIIGVSEGFLANYRGDFGSYNIYSGFKATSEGYFFSLVKTDKSFNKIKEVNLNDYDSGYIEYLNFSTKTDNGLLVRVDDTIFAEFDNELNQINEHYVDTGMLGLDSYEFQPIKVENNELIIAISNVDDQQIIIAKHDLSTGDINEVARINDANSIVGIEKNENLSLVYENSYGTYNLVGFNANGNILLDIELPVSITPTVYDFVKLEDGYLLKYSEDDVLKILRVKNNSVLYNKEITEYSEGKVSDGIVYNNKYYALNTSENMITITNLTDGSHIKSVPLPFQGDDYNLRTINRDSKSFFIELGVMNYDTYNPDYVIVRLDDELIPMSPSGSSGELTLGVSTNQIIFEDYSGIDDSLNDEVILSVSSELPYNVGITMTENFKGSNDATASIRSSNLSVKLSEESDSKYRPFTTGKKEVIIANAPKGEDVKHNLNFKMTADSSVKEDIYTTTLQFEVEQQ